MKPSRTGSCAVLLASLSMCYLASVGAARPVVLAKPDYSIYHTQKGVLDEVGRIVSLQPTFMQVEDRTQSDGNYSSTLSIVTVEPGGFTADHSNKLRLLLVFGEHGRELISSEVALRLLEVLADAEKLRLLSKEQGIDYVRLQQLLSQTVFQVVPMENVRGRSLVEAGALCERKNGRGVDPNRNWAVHWGFKEADYDPAEEFPGAGPFSEPETAMLREVAAAFRPLVWVNVHSGMEALFMPYDHQARVPEGPAAEATLAILAELNRTSCGGRCAVGSGGKSVGYLAHGTATDHMYDVLKVPLAMTWEIYGDLKASYEDCFRMFNPLTQEAFEEVVSHWVAAFFRLILLLPSHPATPKFNLQGRFVMKVSEMPTVSSMRGETVASRKSLRSSDRRAQRRRLRVGYYFLGSMLVLAACLALSRPRRLDILSERLQRMLHWRGRGRKRTASPV